MKKWKYFELIAYYHKSFFVAIEQNITIDMAISTTFESYFFYPEEEYLIANLISTIQNINIQISLLKRVNRGSVELLQNQLLKVSNDFLQSELEVDEIEHLKEDIEEVIYKLKTIETF